MNTLRRSLVVLLLFALAAGSRGDDPPAKKEKAADPKPKEESLFPNTPIGAYKTFILAMAMHDEATLKEIVLPTDDFEWLLKAPRVPDEKLDQLKRALSNGLKVRLLKAGEEVKLPGHRLIRIRKEEVTGENAIVLPAGLPFPARCQKVDGRWRIDARPFIAAQRSDAEARKSKDKTARP